jgi:hypothetical protein
MSRLFKYIPVFVLWIAGIGLFGHMIMIHDHHSEAVCSAENEKCPASEQSKDQHSGSPIHCHAFNDIAAEKAVPFQFQSNVQCNDLILRLADTRFIFELSVCSTLYPIPQTPYLNPYLSDSSSLRGPPSFS